MFAFRVRSRTRRSRRRSGLFASTSQIPGTRTGAGALRSPLSQAPSARTIYRVDPAGLRLVLPHRLEARRITGNYAEILALKTPRQPDPLVASLAGQHRTRFDPGRRILMTHLFDLFRKAVHIPRRQLVKTESRRIRGISKRQDPALVAGFQRRANRNSTFREYYATY